jgi:hypothetical protein
MAYVHIHLHARTHTQLLTFMWALADTIDEGRRRDTDRIQDCRGHLFLCVCICVRVREYMCYVRAFREKGDREQRKNMQKKKGNYICIHRYTHIHVHTHTYIYDVVPLVAELAMVLLGDFLGLCVCVFVYVCVCLHEKHVRSRAKNKKSIQTCPKTHIPKK